MTQDATVKKQYVMQQSKKHFIRKGFTRQTVLQLKHSTMWAVHAK